MPFNNCITTYLQPNIIINTIVTIQAQRKFWIDQTNAFCQFIFLDLGQEACCPIVGTLPVCVPSLVGLVTVLVVAGEVGLVAVAGLGWSWLTQAEQMQSTAAELRSMPHLGRNQIIHQSRIYEKFPHVTNYSLPVWILLHQSEVCDSLVIGDLNLNTNKSTRRLLCWAVFTLQNVQAADNECQKC